MEFLYFCIRMKFKNYLFENIADIFLVNSLVFEKCDKKFIPSIIANSVVLGHLAGYLFIWKLFFATANKIRDVNKEQSVTSPVSV